MQFVKFTEHNDWEGESWNFWVQLDGNEAELTKLKSFLQDNDLEGKEGYELNMNPINEEEVNTLVEHTDSGYMSYENKVEGTFTMPPLPEQTPEDWAYGFSDTLFYKGGIRDLFKQ